MSTTQWGVVYELMGAVKFFFLRTWVLMTRTNTLTVDVLTGSWRAVSARR